MLIFLKVIRCDVLSTSSSGNFHSLLCLDCLLHSQTLSMEEGNSSRLLGSSLPPNDGMSQLKPLINFQSFLSCLRNPNSTSSSTPTLNSRFNISNTATRLRNVIAAACCITSQARHVLTNLDSDRSLLTRSKKVLECLFQQV